MKNKNYHLTEEGLERTRKELERLKRFRKKKVKYGAPQCFHSEDVDPEYLNFRKDMSFLDSKIAKLEEVVKNAEIISPPKGKRKEVCLGAFVTLEANGQVDKFHIVGTMEADPAMDKISNESLVGKALMGAKEGDEVTVSSKIEVTYKIKKISY